MTGIEQFRYDGKRALVVGGATGMGAAAAKIVGDLGAEVINLDYAPADAPSRAYLRRLRRLILVLRIGPA